ACPRLFAPTASPSQRTEHEAQTRANSWGGLALTLPGLPAMPREARDELRIALLGCGTVGGAVVRLLETNGDEIRRQTGLSLRLVHVAVAQPSKPRKVHVEPGVLTGDASAAVADERVDAVAEVMGGVEPARTLLL